MVPLLFPTKPLLALTLLLSFFRGSVVQCTTFTFVNKCGDRIWPGILSNSGSSPLETTGFELPAGASRTLQAAPAGWSGRFWARTGCAFDAAGHGSCATGDCGSGGVECNGAGAAPPATLAEFTLGGSGGKDYYDVSLVDGYNLPVVVVAGGGGGGGGSCMATGCAADLNRGCPAELRVGEGEAAGCRSACGAFGSPEYCCSGEYNSPAVCRPSVYAAMFKAACPRSYSYAYDDASSTFTCASAGQYSIIFCPDTTKSSQKSTANLSPETTGANGKDDSWLANLATGSDANPMRRRVFLVLQASLATAVTTCLLTLSL